MLCLWFGKSWRKNHIVCIKYLIFPFYARNEYFKHNFTGDLDNNVWPEYRTRSSKVLLDSLKPAPVKTSAQAKGNFTFNKFFSLQPKIPAMWYKAVRTHPQLPDISLASDDFFLIRTNGRTFLKYFFIFF